MSGLSKILWALFVLLGNYGCSGHWRYLHKEAGSAFFEGRVYDAIDLEQQAYYIAISSTNEKACVNIALSLSYLYARIGRPQDSISIVNDALIACKSKYNVHLLTALSQLNYEINNINEANKYHSMAMKSKYCDNTCRRELNAYRYYYYGEYQKAIGEMEALLKRKYTIDHTKWDSIIRNHEIHLLLYQLLCFTGKYKESQNILNNMYNKFNNEWGEKNPLVVHLLVEYAYLSLITEDYDGAINYCLRWKKNTRYMDIDNGDLYACDYVINEAKARKGKRRWKNTYINRYIKYLRSIYVNDPPNIAFLLVEEAKAEFSHDNYDYILGILNRACEIYETTGLTRHPGYGLASGAIGAVMMQEGDYKNAIIHLEKSRDIYASSIGKDSSAYVDVLIRMASAYASMNCYEEARSILIDIENNKYYNNSSNRMRLRISEIKCFIYTNEDRLNDAEIHCKDVLEKKENLFGKGNDEVAVAKAHLAVVLYKKKEISVAINMLEDALKILRQYNAKYKNTIVEIMEMLEYMYRNNGEMTKAMMLEKEISDIKDRWK